MNRRFAEIGRRTIGTAMDDDPVTAMALAAYTLHYLGETVKCDIILGRRHPHDYAALHAIARWALRAGCERTAIAMQIGGAIAAATLESLYFRALLLARFANGSLSSRQIEILDAWLVMSLPAIVLVRTPPPGLALRADLESRAGLARGPNPSAGASLYLPQQIIRDAHDALVRAFHQGKVLPADGFTSQFPLTDHVAVLDAIASELAESLPGAPATAERHVASVIAEVHVGLAEILKHAFTPGAPIEVAEAMKMMDAGAKGSKARGAAFDAVYERARRLLHLIDLSDSGLGLEGKEAAAAGIQLGDIVALRIVPLASLSIGKVTRSLPAAANSAACELGVRLLSNRPRLLEVRNAGEPATTPSFPLAYVPGDDPSGRHDAFLVGERMFAEGKPLETRIGENTYRFCFNRVRDRGPGWILAGFEILDLHNRLTTCAARR
jgi:hypothetical protein